MSKWVKNILAISPLIGLIMVFGVMVWLLASPPPGATPATTSKIVALFSTLAVAKVATDVATGEPEESGDE